jgi:hypothetical protein
MGNVDISTASGDDFPGPTANSLKQLASQLDLWRGMLPLVLQWPEDDPTVFPIHDIASYDQSLDPNLVNTISAQQGTPLFNLDREPVHYPFAYDIQVALLRTRYYYAKYMVHRPFVYKALHFPEQMTDEDANGAADCLKVSYSHTRRTSVPSRQSLLGTYQTSSLYRPA